jgi:transposase-like protein
MYGIDVSPDLISTVTDAVLEEVAAWCQHRDKNGPGTGLKWGQLG